MTHHIYSTMSTFFNTCLERSYTQKNEDTKNLPAIAKKIAKVVKDKVGPLMLPESTEGWAAAFSATFTVACFGKTFFLIKLSQIFSLTEEVSPEQHVYGMVADRVCSAALLGGAMAVAWMGATLIGNGLKHYLKPIGPEPEEIG